MTTRDQLLKLLATLRRRRPAPTQPRRLDALFAELRALPVAAAADPVEDQIWALWSSHDDADAEDALASATRAVAARRYAAALPILNDLVQRHPDWSEAWNQRATLHYLTGDDAASFADIHRTLLLEPRHYGAVCGFAQICLRRGDRASALLAFETALALNPHLHGVRSAVAELHELLPATRH